MSKANDIFSTYVHFHNDSRANLIAVSKSFWEEVVGGSFPQLDQGRLMSAFTFSEPWSMWERHPAGEELVMLLSGSATLLLEESGVEQSVVLSTPGRFILIPQNVWHTVKTTEPTAMLFLTPGAGTEHRPISV
ncbi:cupin domain-containing protein [Frateuria sp. Soil773]|uniref:cupin domain-containing protein n=1 Tax=Frateuria sp. Soil773 TaxID=1736407 RepID=UPI0009EC4E42|nr:cupin domain-containing protein [Frateuria sp. Soil773]